MTESLSASAAITLFGAAMAILQSALVMLFAALLIGVRRPSATAAHGVWLTGLGACVIISLLPSVASPAMAIALPMPAWIDGPIAGAIGVSLTDGPFRSNWNPLVGAWAVGATILLARLGIDVLSARRLVRRGTPVARGIVRSKQVRTPAVFGLTIILPDEAGRWDRVDREAVLVHERAHVQRRDPLILLMSRAFCSLCWFNPVVWMVSRRMEAARECACDDAVVRAGMSPFRYARFLVELATRGGESSAIRSMATLTSGHSPFRARVRRLLTPSVRRDAMPLTTLLVSSLLLVAMTCLMAVRPDTRRLHFLPVSEGTLFVEGHARRLAWDMWPIAYPPGDLGRVRVTLHSIRAIRETRSRPATTGLIRTP